MKKFWKNNSNKVLAFVLAMQMFTSSLSLSVRGTELNAEVQNDQVVEIKEENPEISNTSIDENEIPSLDEISDDSSTIATSSEASIDAEIPDLTNSATSEESSSVTVSTDNSESSAGEEAKLDFTKNVAKLDIYPLFIEGKGQQEFFASNGRKMKPYLLKVEVEDEDYLKYFSGLDFDTNYLELLYANDYELKVNEASLSWQAGKYSKLYLAIALPSDWNQNFSSLYSRELLNETGEKRVEKLGAAFVHYNYEADVNWLQTEASTSAEENESLKLIISAEAKILLNAWVNQAKTPSYSFENSLAETINSSDESLRGEVPELGDFVADPLVQESELKNLQLDIYPVLDKDEMWPELQVETDVMLPYILRLSAEGDEFKDLIGLDFNTEQVEIIAGARDNIRVESGKLLWEKGLVSTAYLALLLPSDWNKQYRSIYESDELLTSEDISESSLRVKQYADFLTVDPFKVLYVERKVATADEERSAREIIEDLARFEISAWAHGIVLPQIPGGEDSDLASLIEAENRMSTKVQEAIEKQARYDIVNDPYKFESKHNEVDGTSDNKYLDFDVSAKYDSTGEFIIWTIAARHHDSSNQQLYFLIDPHDGIEKEPPVSQVTVSPYRYMEWIYNPENNRYISGYSPNVNEDGFRNRINIWSSFQEVGGERPVPPNEWVILQYRTKITDKTKSIYSLGAQAWYSYFGTSGTYPSRTYSKAVDCYIEGKTKDIRIELPYFNTNNSDELTINVKSDRNGDPNKVYRTITVTANDKINSVHAKEIKGLERYNEKGEKIVYKLELKSKQNKQVFSHVVDTDGETFSIDSSDKSDVNPSTIGGPYSDTKVDFPILPGYQYQGDLTSVEVNGAYTPSGDKIVWTVSVSQEKGDNQDLYLQFATFPGHQVSSDTSLITSRPKQYDKLSSISFSESYDSNLGKNLRWINQELKIPGTNKGVTYTFQIISNITDKDAETYDFLAKGRFNNSFVYKFGDYQKIVRLDGLKYNPKVKFHYRSVAVGDTYKQEKNQVARSIKPVIKDSEGKTVAELIYNEEDSTYKLREKLNRFDEKGDKIFYYVDFNRDDPALQDYDFSTGLKLKGRYDYELTAYKKASAYPEVKGDEPQWGVTAVDPIEFKFSNDVAKDYNNPRLPSGFFGMFAKLSGTFRVPDTAKRGDKFTLKLPADFNIKAGSDFDIYDPETRESIASVQINPDTNLLTFTLSEYVDTHEGVTGRFSMGPILSSIWDSYNSYVNKKFIYESNYLPLNEIGFIHSRGSADYPRANYGDDDTRDVVFKEEFDEGSDYITYAIGLNRANSRRADILSEIEEIFEPTDSGSWYLYGGKDTAPEDAIKIYSLPSIDEAGAARHYMIDKNLIWPQDNTGMGYNVKVTMKGNKEGFYASIRRKDPRQLVGPIVMLVKCQKHHFFADKPQKNTVGVNGVKKYWASSSRYATYGDGSGSGVTRTLRTGRVNIRKVDLEEANKLLPGAEFKLYKKGDYNPENPDDNLIATLTTNQWGEAKYEKPLPIGEYTLVETVAPEGYKKLINPIDFKLRGTANYQNIHVSNTKRPGINLIKINKLEAGSDIYNSTIQPLYGAVYQLYDENNQKIGEEVKTDYKGFARWTNITKPGKYYALEVKSPNGYVLPSDGPSKFEADRLWEQRKVWFDVKIENGEIISDTQYAENRSDEASIHLYKIKSGVAESSNPTEIIPDAVFGIFDASDYDNNTKSIKEDAKPFQIRTTGPTGLAVFTGLSAHTKYYLKELVTPKDYQIKEEIYEVTSGEKLSAVTKYVENEEANGNRKLTIKKVSETDQSPLANTYFELRKFDDKKLVRSGRTNPEGLLVFDKLQAGKYLLYETIPTEGFLKGVKVKENEALLQADGSVLIDLSSDSQFDLSYTLTNKPDEPDLPPKEPKGSLKIYKKELANKVAVNGISFQLTNEDNSYNETKVTSQDGSVEFTDLPYGKYTLKELNFPLGFRKILIDRDMPETEVRYRDNADTVEVNIGSETKELSLYNVRKRVKIHLDKKSRLATETDNQAVTLDGAEFSLKEKGKADSEAVKKKSANNGQVEFDNLEVGKTYVIWESVVPVDHKASILKFAKLVDGKSEDLSPNEANRYEITIPDQAVDDSNLITLNYLVVNEKLPKGKLKIIKKDLKSKQVLNGINFELRSSDSKIVKNLTTQQNGELEFTDLPYGEYTLKELNFPLGFRKILIDKDVAETEVKFRENADTVKININSETKELTLYNLKKRVKIQIDKKSRLASEDDSKAVALDGVEFSLKERTQDDSQAIKKISKNGTIDFENLEIGKTYEIWESKSLDGYSNKALKFMTSDNIELEATDNDRYLVTIEDKVVGDDNLITLRYTVINEKLPPKGKLIISKKDLDTDADLDGVTFTLKKVDGTVNKTASTNSQGVVEFTDLEYGEYKLTETKFLAGYRKILLDSKKNEAEISYTAGAESIDVTIDSAIENKTVYNVKKKAKLSILKKERLASEDDNLARILPGVEFSLKLKDGDEIKTARSQNNGLVEFTGLEIGQTYEIWESDVPTTYSSLPLKFFNTNDNQEVSREENGHYLITVNDSSEDSLTISYTVINEKNPPKSKLVIEKKDSTSKAALSDVKFILMKEASDFRKELTTDPEGKIELDALEAGTYTLEEIEAKEGYTKALIAVKVLSDGKELSYKTESTYKISFSLEAGKTYTIQAENKKEKPILPAVGGPGYIIIRAVAVLILLFALFLVLFKRRNKNEQETKNKKMQ